MNPKTFIIQGGSDADEPPLSPTLSPLMLHGARETTFPRPGNWRAVGWRKFRGSMREFCTGNSLPVGRRGNQARSPLDDFTSTVCSNRLSFTSKDRVEIRPS